jgi:3-methyl-2-oxobutanoate hydroxymethyltransferase
LWEFLPRFEPYPDNDLFFVFMKTTIPDLLAKKKNRNPITMVTAYDFPMARIEDEAGVDVVLVGDSVGTNVLGYASEQEVTLADMTHHVGAVARGVKRALLLADLPFHTADEPISAEANAGKLLEKGADCVKIEGWGEKRAVVEHLSKKNIPVCAHIGYNPQTHGMKAKVFGAVAQEALALVESARQLEEAGARLIVMEKLPEEVAAIITERLGIPAIGIGSGRFCDGQVLVVHDILGFSERAFKHARRFADFRGLALDAVRAYAGAVAARSFPAEENFRHIDPRELEKLKALLNSIQL